MWKSRERESDMLFDFPSNHCVYSITPSSIKREACFLAASFLTLASMLFDSSSFSSLKFVFFNHPAEVVLSVIDSAQSPALRRFAIRSTQGVMIDAMNSRKLFDALNNKSFGILYLQA